MKYLLDSNIIIYHLNGVTAVSEFLEKNHDQAAISRITFIEVLSFDFTNDEENEIRTLLESFIILDTNREISMQAVNNRKKRKIKVPDNIIASTAQVYNLILVTRNDQDFSGLDVGLLNVF